MQREVEQLRRRIDKAMEAAEQLPNVEGLSLDMTEIENLAQDMRLAGAYLKEQIERFVWEPDEQKRLSSAMAVYATLNARLADVKNLEQDVRQLRDVVEAGATAAPPRPGG